MSNRRIADIALDIKKDWQKVNYAAEPYLDAMFALETIDDNYLLDTGRSVVSYFLANAGTWRGPKAREIKAELKAMLKNS